MKTDLHTCCQGVYSFEPIHEVEIMKTQHLVLGWPLLGSFPHPVDEAILKHPLQ